MHKSRPKHALAFLVSSCAALAIVLTGKPAQDELPDSWNLAEIAEQMPHGGGRLYVLAWEVRGDDSGPQSESCLVLKVLDKNEGYALAHLYRRPADEAPKWQLAMTHVVGEKGTKYYPGMWLWHYKLFKEKPGNRELYAALSSEEVDWRFEKSFGQEQEWQRYFRWLFGRKEGREFARCKVCERNWLEAIGEKPAALPGR
jgi:hypothetical protein